MDSLPSWLPEVINNSPLAVIVLYLLWERRQRDKEERIDKKELAEGLKAQADANNVQTRAVENLGQQVARLEGMLQGRGND